MRTSNWRRGRWAEEIKRLKTAQIRTEAEETMNCGLAVDFSVGLENGGAVAGDPAFRCGLPLRGGGWLLRDAGPRIAIPTMTRQGAAVKIAWPRDVAWRKPIRFSKS